MTKRFGESCEMKPLLWVTNHTVDTLRKGWFFYFVLWYFLIVSLPHTPTSHSHLSTLASFFLSISFFHLSFGTACATGAHGPNISFLNKRLPTTRAAVVFICQVLKRRVVPDTPLVRKDKQAGRPLLFSLALICVTKTEGSPQVHLPNLTASHDSFSAGFHIWWLLFFWFRSQSQRRMTKYIILYRNNTFSTLPHVKIWCIYFNTYSLPYTCNCFPRHTSELEICFHSQQCHLLVSFHLDFSHRVVASRWMFCNHR